MAKPKTAYQSYRSAVTGQYISQQQAERKSRESVRETNQRGNTPQKGKRS
jgi:hypothetical protein